MKKKGKKSKITLIDNVSIVGSLIVLTESYVCTECASNLIVCKSCNVNYACKCEEIFSFRSSR